MTENKRRRARPEGQIIPKGENKHQLRIFMGRDEVSGKKSYYTETFRGTKTQASARLRLLHTRRDNDEPMRESNVTFETFFHEWLRNKKSDDLRERSIEHYRQVLTTHAIPLMGGASLKGITASTIQTLKNRMSDKGLSPNTQKFVLVLLKDMFTRAVELEMIRKNPMANIKPPKQSQKETQALTREQMTQLLGALEGSREYAMFALALTTGARPGEYLALQWSDIDGQAGTVTVNKGIVWRKAGDWYMTDPKSESSRRTLTLPPQIVRALAEHRRRQNEEKLKAGSLWNRKHDFVFTDEAGHPLFLGRVRYLWKRAIKAAGLPETFKLYSTRHTAATNLIHVGLDAKNVQRQLGHSNPVITMTRYINDSSDLRREANDRLADDVFPVNERS